MSKVLEKALEQYHHLFPEDENIKDWAGCNYYINQGNNECEPEGTATSMHECEGCEKINFCLIKQPTRIWEWNENVEKKLRMKTLMTNRGIQ